MSKLTVTLEVVQNVALRPASVAHVTASRYMEEHKALIAAPNKEVGQIVDHGCEADTIYEWLRRSLPHETLIMLRQRLLNEKGIK